MVVAGGMFVESVEGDDAVSVSSGAEPEEEPVSPVTARGGLAVSSTRRRGLPTPPATPSTPSKGGKPNSLVWWSALWSCL